MRSEHIIDQCWWEMPGKPDPKVGWPGTKNGHPHKVYLPTMVQEMLVELNDDGFVLAGRGGRKPIARLDDAMRNICPHWVSAARSHRMTCAGPMERRSRNWGSDATP